MNVAIKQFNIAICLPAAALLAAALLAGGCAIGGGGSAGPALNTASAKTKTKKNIFGGARLKPGGFAKDGRYIPSADEGGLNCKRIRGKMGVRIAQLRANNNAKDTSFISRSLSGIFGGAKQGLDGQTRSRRDRAILVAYNRLLAQKNCPTVDLDEELASRAARPDAGSPAGEPAGQPVRPQTR